MDSIILLVAMIAVFYFLIIRRFVIISAQFVIFGLKIIFVLLAAILKFIFSNKSYFSSIFRCSAQLFPPNYGERHTCQAAKLLLYFL